MTDTFVFVKETSDSWIYEGLAIPYGGPVKGQDLTGSHFTKDSDLCLDWFPDGGRPLLYRHGFDPEVKAAPVGREIGAVREDDKGRWYRIQLDKAKAYASEVKQLADEGLLALSSGAVDHLAQIAAKTGEIKMWPWVELSFVPNPANPEALVYPVKSADAIEHLHIVDTAVPEAMQDDPAPPATKAIQTFSDIIASAEMDEELPEAFQTLQSAIYSAIWATDAEFNPVSAEEKQAAIATSLGQFQEWVLGIMDRAGKSAPLIAMRATRPDPTNIQSIHDAMHALGAECAAAKDSEPAPRLVITGTAAAKEEPDLSELTAAMSEIATATAKELLRIA